MKCDICLEEFDENLAKECETKKYNVCDECCINDCCDKCETIVIMRKQLIELREKLRWIPVVYKNNTIPRNVPLYCRLKWCWSGKVIYAALIYVEADDNCWVTADDKSEIDFNVDVTHYMQIPELGDGE
jgi:hypothetical protein